jgi:uncharacterized protein (DUF488 family)
MEICSIGASGNSAERFFGVLKINDVTSIIDTRIHASSQLAGFTRKESLLYFAKTILDIPYFHETLLAPEDKDLKAYRNKEISWQEYEDRYLNLISNREVVKLIDFTLWGLKPVLLCSENTAENCHRRLAAEFIKKEIETVTQITHL